MQAKVLMDKLTDIIAREVETFYNTVGEVEGKLMANKVAARIASAESQGTCTQADQGLGRGEGRYTGGKTSTPANEYTGVRQLLK